MNSSMAVRNSTSKQLPKASKDRPRSSETKKNRHDGKGSPERVPSVTSVDGEQKKVIVNDDILALEIKPEDLEKLREPRPPVEPPPLYRSVIVRKQLLPEPAPLRSKTVVVAIPRPRDSDVQFPDYAAMAGARFDSEGRIVPHSILGEVDEFIAEARDRGDLPIEMQGRFSGSRPSSASGQLGVKYEKKTDSDRPKFESGEESNALKNWEQRMRQRRNQQDYLASVLKTSPESLAMNQGDTMRKTTELRDLIDRTIPYIDNGKGYRVGSEFWSLPAAMKGGADGLNVTLTRSENGRIASIIHTGVPQTVLGEKGLSAKKLTTSTIHKPWHMTPYLRERVTQLAPLMDEIDPYDPDTLELEIIGNKIRPTSTESRQSSSRILTNRSVNNVQDQTVECDPFRDHPDVRQMPVFGPSILFSGQSARWTGEQKPVTDLPEIGVEARVNFESTIGERATAFLDLTNDGTTAINYDWKKLPESNTFCVNKVNVQRFYFNTARGVVLPGDTVKFPFVFKSPNSGIFTEQWQLVTHPVLCSGAPLLVTLRGVILKEDDLVSERVEIEKCLAERQSQQIVKYVIDCIFDGVHPTERPRSPLGAYATEEEIFLQQNPKFSYMKEKCEQFKKIYSDALAEGGCESMDWDLNISTIHQLIMSLPVDSNKRDSLLQQLNQTISSISFQLTRPSEEQRVYNIGYQLLCSALDKIVDRTTTSATELKLSGKTDQAEETGGGGAAAKKRSTKAISGKKSTQKVIHAETLSAGIGSELDLEQKEEQKFKDHDRLEIQAYTVLCNMADDIDAALADVLGRYRSSQCIL